ncbi:MAG: hypothetical protein ACR2PH_13850 [Desulfobulbia bacterium]
MKSIRTKLILCIALLLLFSTITFSLTSSVIGQEVPPAIEVGADGVLFAIGVVDEDVTEFQQFDWEGIKDYECTVGVDCESKNFPGYIMRRSLADKWDYLGIAQVTINFNLNRTYENVSLRIARKGTGTTIVELDDSVSHSVTSRMLDSGSYDNYGSYDLGLGTLDAGIHNIKLTMEEGGMGRGRYGWDAIILLVKRLVISNHF